MLDGSNDMLFAMLLPDVQMMRTALRALQVRAMWHLGEGRSVEAWQDLLACHRLARLTSENFTLVGQLVGMAIEGRSCTGTSQFLHHADLDAEVARQILTELQRLGPASSSVQAIDQGERLFYLDTVMHLAKGKGLGGVLEDLGIPSEGEVVFRAKIDWNTLLRKGNVWYDELVAAAKLPSREKRNAAFDRIDQKLAQISLRSKHPSAWVGSVLSSKRRTEMASDILLSLTLPAVSAAFSSEDRTSTQLELTRLAAALAVYRAEQGAYPEQLAELVPGVLSKLPVDLYSEKSFLYERKDDGGFLLYSVFENGIDDGGDSMSGEVVDGEWVKVPSEDFDYSEGDLVIRVPVPGLEFPALPLEGE